MIIIISIIKDAKILAKYRYLWPQQIMGCGPQFVHFTFNLDEMQMQHDMEYNQDVTAIGNKETDDVGYTMLFRAVKNIRDEINYGPFKPDNLEIEVHTREREDLNFQFSKIPTSYDLRINDTQMTTMGIQYQGIGRKINDEIKIKAWKTARNKEPIWNKHRQRYEVMKHIY